MNPIVTTVGELQSFISDMRKAHGVVELIHDDGCPLDIEVDGIQLNSVDQLDLMKSETPVTVYGNIQYGYRTTSRVLQAVFREWQRGQVSVSKIVVIPQDKLKELEQFLKLHGGCLTS